MKGFLFFLFYLAIAASVFSQGTVSGTVIDSLNRAAVEYASVSIYKTEDGKLVNGQLSDSAGGFGFTNVTPGNYYLRIDFMGYRTMTVKGIAVSKAQITNLGNILIAHSTQYLNEVIISSQQYTVCR